MPQTHPLQSSTNRHRAHKYILAKPENMTGALLFTYSQWKKDSQKLQVAGQYFPGQHRKTQQDSDDCDPLLRSRNGDIPEATRYNNDLPYGFSFELGLVLPDRSRFVGDEFDQVIL
jgi:hypothetical protein